jgi:hypothetical protein
MPQGTEATIVQTNFTAGEVSPRMLGRVDVERYKNGAKYIENCLPLIHGGCKSAPGTKFVASTKYADKKARLIRFEFSKTQAHMLEFGHLYMRVFNQDGSQVMSGGSPYEIVTPFTESQLFEMEYVGGSDTIFLFHESVFPQRLQRYDSDYWVIGNAPFVVEPFAEQGRKPAAALTLSASTVGTGRTFTAGSAVFLHADVGRSISYRGGSAVITGYTSTTVVTCTIEMAFESTSIASGDWTLEGSPQRSCSPSKHEPVGEEITLTLSEAEKTITGLSHDATSTVTVTANNHGYTTGDSVNISQAVPAAYNGTYSITVTDSNNFNYTLSPDPGTVSTLGLAKRLNQSAGWRSDDVGKYVRINSGLCEITNYVSTAVVQAKIKQALSADVAAPALAWSLESTVWSSTLGYPRCGTFYEQRLVVAGSTYYPHSFWASRTGEYLNFELGTNDDDAIYYTLSVSEHNPILHLEKIKRQLSALTSGGEFTITGGVDKPLTPSNIQIDDPTDYGCNDVRPVRVGNELCYIQRAGTKLRAMAYQFEKDSFGSIDLTKLSEHITSPGIVDLAYQQEPESIVWGVRSDGVMVTMCIDRDENVISWARQTTDGEYESVESIPGDTGDDTWVEVKRTINGATVRYIERFDNAVYSLHSAVTGTSSIGAATWTGLDHLEGETVDIVADGAVMQQQAVSGGQVTLERSAYAVQIGLPVRPSLTTLNPELVTQSGSSQGNRVSVSEVTLRVLDTVGLKINGTYKDFRRLGSELLDQPPPSYTGDLSLELLGINTTFELLIEADNPLPFHVLAVIKKLTVNS